MVLVFTEVYFILKKWDTYQQLWYLDSASADTQFTKVDTLHVMWSVLQGCTDYIVDNSGIAVILL